jgi:Holliday junction DNA helicase RuvA
MYAFVEGEIIDRSDTRIVIRPEGMGIGLTVNVAPRTSLELPNVGGTARLYTSFQVREDSQALYGFESTSERDLFEALLKISGIGGKTALAILDLPRDRIVEAIAAGDAGVLQRVQGVGAKTAGRIVLELKDRFAEELIEEWADTLTGKRPWKPTMPENESEARHEFAEAVEALIGLGYMRADARELVRKARLTLGDEAPSEELIRFVLKHAG